MDEIVVLFRPSFLGGIATMTFTDLSDFIEWQVDFGNIEKEFKVLAII